MDEDLKRLLDVLRKESSTAHVETRRHFDVVAEHLRRDVQTVAEGVTANTERIDGLRSEMKEAFADVGAMIKFSHAELHRRVRTLEETHRTLEETQRKLEEALSELQTRVERLESPTH